MKVAKAEVFSSTSRDVPLHPGFRPLPPLMGVVSKVIANKAVQSAPAPLDDVSIAE